MSKQEKLDALLTAVATYATKVPSPGFRGEMVQKAFAEYLDTPDDPPPRPEMPECVARLCEYLDETIMEGAKKLASKVRDHYAQPLKLEVGKCYADANGEVGKVFWFDKSKSLFQVVMLETGYQRHCHAGGRSHYQSHPDFVREVPNG